MATNSVAALTGNSSASATAASATAATNGTQSSQDLSKQFLKLLVAQVQNQDPLKPMDNSQFTSQIAQINTVSGINKLNDQLAMINGQINTSQQLQASALIGHTVLVPGNSISVGTGGTAMPFGVDLAAPAAKITMTITDKSGAVVHQSSYTNQAAGVQSFSWDGLDSSGKPVTAGSYHLSIKAENADGKAVAAKTLSTGLVSGVVAGGSGPQLDLGPNGLVGLKDIYQII
ncbi:MAG: flagellar hook assembly protein FlgD [Salinisphaera sp.]|jgi:flagellar basal-body rod modification protein FlgD|nr:flagellar hook assembly protein FlgD [Salinisphaera sp.]